MLWRAAWVWTKGYRLRPWKSPYLRWRIETFWGWHADQIAARDFLRFSWQRRREMARFLKWAAKMPAESAEIAGKTARNREMFEMADRTG